MAVVVMAESAVVVAELLTMRQDTPQWVTASVAANHWTKVNQLLTTTVILDTAATVLQTQVVVVVVADQATVVAAPEL